MEITFITTGIICLLAAIVGGGLKGFGFEFPTLQSIHRQILLGTIGIVCVVASQADKIINYINNHTKPNPSVVNTAVNDNNHMELNQSVINIPKDARFDSYKIDIFWCDESGVEARNQAENIAEYIKSTLKFRQGNVRMITNDGKHPWASGYEIRVDPDGKEDNDGRLLSNHLAKKFPYKFTGWPSNTRTEKYLSVFICPGVSAEEELNDRKILF